MNGVLVTYVNISFSFRLPSTIYFSLVGFLFEKAFGQGSRLQRGSSFLLSLSGKCIGSFQIRLLRRRIFRMRGLLTQQMKKYRTSHLHKFLPGIFTARMAAQDRTEQSCFLQKETCPRMSWPHCKQPRHSSELVWAGFGVIELRGTG